MSDEREEQDESTGTARKRKRDAGEPTAKDVLQSFAQDQTDWKDIQEGRQKDIRALGPDSTWDTKEREARKSEGRPCLSTDELGQYVNQLANDVRDSKRAIEINPEDDETSEHEARALAALIRQIEYESNAQVAYARMFEDAASGSYGFLRIVPEFVESKIVKPSARSFDQRLAIKAIHNAELVTPSYFTEPDMSDCERFWIQERFTHESFEARFPDREVKETRRGLPADVTGVWCDDRGIWVRELWQLKTRKKKLALVEVPVSEAAPEGVAAFWSDTIPEGVRVLRERDVDEPYVCQTITNGLEVLEHREDWPGQYLPIVGCVGKVLWIDGKKTILSLIRKSHDAQQLLNYTNTSKAEVLAMVPKFPWFYYEGALSNTEMGRLENANRVPVGGIAVKATATNWNPAWGPVPFPTRNPYEPPIQAFEMAAESTRRSVQSATGTGFLPTEAQRQNQKSGVALKQIATSAAKGAWHFVDNYETSLRRVGKILQDLAPYYYDRPRTVSMRTKTGEPQKVRINDPNTPAGPEFGGKPIMLRDAAAFNVTISTGPSWDSERDKASDFADNLATVRPEIFSIIGPEIVRLKNLGPEGDKLIELLEAMQPPAIQALRRGQGAPNPEVQQAMAQLQQAQQVIQQLQRVIEGEQVKTQGALELKKLDGQIRMALAELQGRQKLQQQAAQVAADIDAREDEQAHDVAIRGADDVASERAAERAAEQARAAAVLGPRPFGAERSS